MLGKLLKYDLKWVYKLLVIYYALALFFGLIGRLFSLFDEIFVFDFISQFSCGVAVAMMFNILINNIIRVWVRFIHNIYKDESYLTHTLPVKKSDIYLSKALTALITMSTSLVITVVTLVLCYWSDGLVDFIKTILPGASLTVVVLACVVLVLELIFLIFLGYLGITIGYRRNQNKLLMSFLSGFIIYSVSSCLSLVVLFIAGLFNKELLDLFTTLNAVPSVGLMKYILIIAIILYLLYIILCNIISNKLLQKGVNVD